MEASTSRLSRGFFQRQITPPAARARPIAAAWVALAAAISGSFDIEPCVNAREGQLHDAALGGFQGGRVGLEQLVPRLDLVDEQLDEAQIVRARLAPLALLVQQEQRLEHRVRVALYEVLILRLVARG